MKTKVVNAYAKINLFLEVTGKLSNGYHDIQSVMQSVSLCDTLHIELNNSGIFSLECPKLTCETKDNLIFKAATEFFSASDIRFSGISVSVEKNIPVCAGLAGGSSDAAAILCGLNELYGVPFSSEELRVIGKKIGADVPFCLLGGTAMASGIGEKLTPLQKLPKCFIVIAKGDKGINTKWAFEHLDTIENRSVKHTDGIISAIASGVLSDICEEFYNVFEVVSPFDDDIKKTMMSNGALGSLMSGSGPSVFGVFNDEGNAEKATRMLKNKGYSSFLCVPENKI